MSTVENLTKTHACRRAADDLCHWSAPAGSPAS